MKRILYLLIALTIIFASIKIASTRYEVDINNSPSMPPGLYLVDKWDLSPQRGDIVITCPNQIAIQYARRYHNLENGECPGGFAPLIKRAVAIAGDSVNLSSAGVRTQNGLLPGSRPIARSGPKILPKMRYGSYRIQPHAVWLWTSQWYSFDSRYYGATDIIGVAWPIWVKPITIATSPPPGVIVTFRQ